MAFAAPMMNPDECGVIHRVTMPSKEKPIGFRLQRTCSFKDHCGRKTNNTQGKLLYIFLHDLLVRHPMYISYAKLLWYTVEYPTSYLDDKVDIRRYTTRKRCIALFYSLPLKTQWATQAMPHTRIV